MAYLDGLKAAQDALYAQMGVACVWTPAGTAAVNCTALLAGGDDVTRFRSESFELNVRGRRLRLRDREIAALTAAKPSAGDLVTIPDGSFRITGDPRQEDPRRLEWTLELADV